MKKPRVTKKKSRPVNRVAQAHGSKTDTRVRSAHTPSMKEQRSKDKREKLKKNVRRSYI